MICSRCGMNAVIWSGPMSELGQHGTECRNCGATNSQVVVVEEVALFGALWCAGCGEALTVKDGRWICEGCGTDWGECVP